MFFYINMANMNEQDQPGIKAIANNAFCSSFGNPNKIKTRVIPISVAIITVLIVFFVISHIGMILEMLRLSGIIFGIIQVIGFVINCIYIICYYTIVIVLINQYFVNFR